MAKGIRGYAVYHAARKWELWLKATQEAKRLENELNHVVADMSDEEFAEYCVKTSFEEEALRRNR